MRRTCGARIFVPCASVPSIVAIDSMRASTYIVLMKTRDRKEAELKRYVGRVRHNGVLIGSEYVDWFTDDDDARAGYRIIMEQQGYKVKVVTIGNPCIVEIE